MEKELHELDELDNNPARSYRLASIQYDKDKGDSKRIELIERIDQKLEQYGSHSFN